jgi:hypothetical protein
MEVGGISSQLLRYIEILLVSPWSVTLGEELGFPLSPQELTRPQAITVLHCASELAHRNGTQLVLP